MSEQDYYKIERKLKSAIKKAEKIFKSAPNLDQKINAGRALKSAREELRQHRLRYYDFEMSSDKTISLTLITLSSGDCGLILNDAVIMTADPQFEPIDQVETVGFNLANTLACEINVIKMNTPQKDDWNWNDVLMLHLNS